MTEEQQDGGALRKQLEKALEEIQSLKGELGTFREKERGASLADALRQAGKDPRAVALLPGDLDSQGLKGWLKDNGDLIADLKPEAGAPPVEEPEEPAGEPVDENLRRAVGAEATSGDPGDAMSELNRAGNLQELNAFLQKQGLPGSIL